MQIKSFAAVSMLLFACNQPAETPPIETKAAESAPTAAINMQGYTPSYSNSFEMGDPKNADIVMQLYKDWDDGTPNIHKELFADTVQMSLSDGSVTKGPKDSALANGAAYRDLFKEVKTTVHSVFPTKSTDKNENWVCIWAKEVHTEKASGKTDSVELQEAWRFDKDGKVNWILQYSRPAAPKK
jgi:hypothetical protein